MRKTTSSPSIKALQPQARMGVNTAVRMHLHICTEVSVSMIPRDRDIRPTHVHNDRAEDPPEAMTPMCVHVSMIVPAQATYLHHRPCGSTGSMSEVISGTNHTRKECGGGGKTGRTTRGKTCGAWSAEPAAHIHSSVREGQEGSMNTRRGSSPRPRHAVDRGGYAGVLTVRNRHRHGGKRHGVMNHTAYMQGRPRHLVVGE